MKRLDIDLWYGDKLSDCDNYNCYFCDCDLEYRGNLFKNGRIVGDFRAEQLQVFEKSWNSTH